ncbi:MAG: hypothetical protein ABI091_29980, partial [Ferruginibacter sp.]
MIKSWINHPTILKGETIELRPLEKNYFEELYLAASDYKLWEHIPSDCSIKDNFESAYNFALAERKKGNQYPFIIFHKETKKIIGSTRFFEIYPFD